jgi:hypothetical protein|eukprot:COSAG01_NODE_2385_length_7787_cov_62.523023_5_plen_83_part_00
MPPPPWLHSALFSTRSRAWIEANRLIRKRALGPAFDSCWDSLLFLNLFVLLMSFFSCNWILLIFLTCIGRLQAAGRVVDVLL